jgi:hypothetical protein
VPTPLLPPHITCDINKRSLKHPTRSPIQLMLTMAGPRTQPSYECGMCGVQSLSRAEHNTHIANHPEIHAATLTCSVCNSSFPDSLELENHTMRSGHGTSQNECAVTWGTCSFTTDRMLTSYRRYTYEPSTADVYQGSGPRAHLVR